MANISNMTRQEFIQLLEKREKRRKKASSETADYHFDSFFVGCMYNQYCCGIRC